MKPIFKKFLCALAVVVYVAWAICSSIVCFKASVALGIINCLAIVALAPLMIRLAKESWSFDD